MQLGATVLHTTHLSNQSSLVIVLLFSRLLLLSFHACAAIVVPNAGATPKLLSLSPSVWRDTEWAGGDASLPFDVLPQGGIQLTSPVFVL